MGCETLFWNSRLAAIAERAARRMALREVAFSHDGATARFAEYPLGAGDTYGENLARSEGVQPLAAAVVGGWEESPGHRRNLLGPFTACGVGAAMDPCGVAFVVQLLARAPGDGEPALVKQNFQIWSDRGTSVQSARMATSGLLALMALLAWQGGWLGS